MKRAVNKDQQEQKNTFGGLQLDDKNDLYSKLGVDFSCYF